MDYTFLLTTNQSEAPDTTNQSEAWITHSSYTTDQSEAPDTFLLTTDQSEAPDGCMVRGQDCNMTQLSPGLEIMFSKFSHDIQ